MPRISEEQKAATRRRLVDAAVQVVRDEGAAAVTTRRILEVAGLSKGALYHYFSSKDEIFEAIAQRFAESDISVLDELSALDAHVLVMEQNLDPGASTVLGRLRAEAADNEAVAEVLRRFDAELVEQFGGLNRRSIESGLFRTGTDPEALVEMIGVFVEGLDLRESTGFATERSRVARSFVEALLASVLNPEHPDAAELSRRLLKAAAR